jgi:hypothetical protein
MTAKEKAEELLDKMYGVTDYQAKQSALVAVDEIINSYPHSYEIEKEKTKNNEDITIITNIKSNIGYWQEVKTEIEKL